MSRRRKKNLNTADIISRMDKNIETIAQNSEEENKNTAELVKSSKSKLPIIISIITLIVTVSGVSVWGIIEKITEKPPQYELYLSSEYTKLKVKAETDITATLNFDADSISITAYLNSIKNGDTLEMIQESDTKWHKKVIFEETGTYKVVATATTPNGDIIEKFIEIEVIPTEGDIFSQIFESIN
ncbi:MAG: hypothetical protein NC389_10680 [Acetatifactor muris]|nr:hypothetical protein [Acetatifactor muris]